ncbi:MAG: hypothetical protein NT166_11470 [Candidatus Aminicenantes bacterium]|nr:hypothetical protein [Candidatus Aminicenantes bacterium]
MKVSARAHPVQGLLCAHGYKDADQKTLPVESIFVSLKSFHTDVGFSFSDTISIQMKGRHVSDDAYERMTGFVGRIFKKLGIKSSYSIDIEPHVPLAQGIGSSASIYAALTKCIVTITGKIFPDKELSALARLGSHSAAASIIGNVSIISGGEYAELLCQGEAFPFKILVLPVEGEKRTEEIHEDMPQSPFYSVWLECARASSLKLKELILKKKFDEIGPIAEKYIHNNFAAISTGPRNILTWNAETFRRIILLKKIRSELNGEFFISTNSGPAVFVYTRSGEETLMKKLKEMDIECHLSEVGGPAALIPNISV